MLVKQPVGFLASSLGSLQNGANACIQMPVKWLKKSIQLIKETEINPMGKVIASVGSIGTMVLYPLLKNAMDQGPLCPGKACVGVWDYAIHGCDTEICVDVRYPAAFLAFVFGAV